MINRLLLFLSCLLLISTSATAGQRAISGEVSVGSTNNRLTIRVNNNTKTVAKNVAVNILESPQGLLNFKVEPATLKSIPLGGTAVFQVSFDVAEDATAIDFAELVFSIAAKNVRFETSYPRLAVAIISSAAEEIEEAAAETEPTAAPILVLDEVTASRGGVFDDFHYQEGALGFYTNVEGGEVQYSLKVKHVPEKIVTNQPFKVDFEVRKYVIHAQTVSCNMFGDSCKVKACNGAREAGSLELQTYVGSRMAQSVSNTSLDVSCAELNSLGVAKTESKLTKIAALRKRGVIHKKDTLQLTLNFIPDGVLTSVDTRAKSPQGNYGIEYGFKYRVEIHSNGETKTEVNQNALGYLVFAQIGDTGKPDFSTLVEGSRKNEFTILIRQELSGGPKLTLKYLPQGVSRGIAVVAYDHPPIPSLSGEMEKSTAQGDGDGSAAPVVGGKPVSPDSSNRPTGAIGSTASKGGVDPQNTDVSGLIKKWIANAQPVENARGAKLKFDKWGRVEGRAVGGIITLHGKPDDVGGRTPEEYVWSKKDQLDSLNLCTLGKFVNLSLQGKLTSGCLKQGQATALKKVELPDVLGKTYKEAVKLLEAAGLVALSPELGSPAPNAAFVGRVELALPTVDGQLHKGDKIALHLFGEAIVGVSVPSVERLGIRAAATAIEAAGLSPVFELGRETTDPRKDQTVAQQLPAAGTSVDKGSEVKLFVLTLVSKEISVPDLQRMSLADAQQLLQKKGLSMAPELGEDATSADEAGRVYSQSPAAGQKVVEGTSIVVQIYGQSAVAEKPRCLGAFGMEWDEDSGRCVDTSPAGQVARHDCSSFPGAFPKWDEQLERPQCVCLNGWTWSKSEQRCVDNSPAAKVARADCSSFGSSAEAYWSYSKEQVMCRCMDGYRFNSNHICVRERVVRNDPPPSSPPRDDTDWQEVAEGLTSLLGAISGSSTQSQPRVQQPSTQRSTQNRCATDYTTNGSYFNCKCSGWGFDPSYGKCRQGFTDKYSSKPQQKSGQVYAGFGNESGSSGGNHPCQDSSARVDAEVLKYARIYGGGETTYSMKGDMVCYRNSYDKITGSSVDSYTCGKNFSSCSRQKTYRIDGRENLSGKGYKLIFDGGKSWWHVWPK